MDRLALRTRTVWRALLACWFAFSCAGCLDHWIAPELSDPAAIDPRASKAPESAASPITEKDQTQPKEEKPEVEPAATSLPWDQRPIGRDSWRLNLVDQRTSAKTRFRWRHVHLESAGGELLITREELMDALDAKLPLAVANANLLLLRQSLDEPESAEANLSDLHGLIRRADLPLTFRRAAIDTLAELGNVGLTTLQELLDEQTRFAEARGTKYQPELHEELLRAVAKLQPVDASPAFEIALAAESPEVRFAAVLAWQTTRCAQLPPRFAELAQDSDARVRRGVIEALVQYNDPRTLNAARDALYDPQLEVHLAAIAALGKLKQPEARELLQKEAQAEGNALRAAAVTSLAEHGDAQTVLAAAEDKNSQVREAAAAALAKLTPTEASRAAKGLLADRSMAVRRAVLQAIAAWPLTESAPLYFDALADRALDTRKSAAQALAARWHAAAEFNPTADAGTREAQLAQLRDRLHQEFGSGASIAVASLPAPRTTDDSVTPPDRLRSLLKQLAGAAPGSETERLALAELANVPGDVEAAAARLVEEEGAFVAESAYPVLLRDEAGECFRDWEIATAADKRQSITALAHQLAQQPFRMLVSRRIIALALEEEDPLIWIAAIEACPSGQDSEVRRFAAASLGHPSPEVRRRACEYFLRYPAPDAINWLNFALGDETSFVAAAAARALTLCGRPESLDALVEMLSREDADCRMSAGAALASYGDERGRAALERLAFDVDPAIRLRAATVMGQLGNEEFAATLIALLDDDQGVRRAALMSLPSVTGHTITLEKGESQQDLVAAWKRWATTR